MDTDRFDRAIATIVTRNHENHGIGTLGEKSVHAVVKCYMEPDEDYHETPIDGYVADIFRDDKVIEIQTGSFEKLRGKLNTFLPNYHVTVVHPIPANKTLCWVDPDTGEVAEKRKSNKHGTPQMIFSELYAIRPFLKDPNLSIVILLIDMEETKLLDGYGPNKKKRATKYDRLPLRLLEEIHLDCPDDYRMLIPIELEHFTSAEFAKATGIYNPIELEHFTSAEFAKATGIYKEEGTTAMQILNDLGVVERVDRTKKGYIYEVVE